MVGNGSYYACVYISMYLPELVTDVADLYDHALLLLAGVHILPLDQEPRGQDPGPVTVVRQVESVLRARVLVKSRVIHEKICSKFQTGL